MLASVRPLPRLIEHATVIQAAGNTPRRIEEFAGRVNSGHNQVTVARTISPGLPVPVALDFRAESIDDRETHRSVPIVEEWPMSLLLLASNLLERVGVRQRTGVPTAPAPAEPPKTETPRQLRDRLREEIRSRGGQPEEIETIPGNCDQQVATQAKDYTDWLARH